MPKFNFIAFDVETATPNMASICQIGIIKVVGGSVISQESILIQPPGNEYFARNTCIHGIDSLMTKNKPLFYDIWESIRDDFSSNLLVAHNASFDISAITSALKYYNLDIPTFNYYCTYKLTKLRLTDLCASLNIDISKHHDALADAKACAEAYIKLKNGINPNLDLISNSRIENSFAGHERITGDLLRPDLECGDKNHLFFNKKIVFTGVLDKITREEAARLVKSKGADIDTGICKKTDYVIVGHGAGPSKLKKIEEYNMSGSFIKILNEDEFVSFL